MTPALRRLVTLFGKAIFIIAIPAGRPNPNRLPQHLPKLTRAGLSMIKLWKALWSNRKSFYDRFGTHFCQFGSDVKPRVMSLVVQQA